MTRDEESTAGAWDFVIRSEFVIWILSFREAVIRSEVRSWDRLWWRETPG
jgi:hypothetical protein